MKIIGLDIADNATLLCGTNFVQFTVTLNIDRETAAIVDNCFKGDKFFVISKKVEIGYHNFDLRKLLPIYKEMVRQLMIEARELKIKKLQNQIIELS